MTIFQQTFAEQLADEYGVDRGIGVSRFLVEVARGHQMLGGAEGCSVLSRRLSLPARGSVPSCAASDRFAGPRLVLCRVYGDFPFSFLGVLWSILGSRHGRNIPEIAFWRVSESFLYSLFE